MWDEPYILQCSNRTKLYQLCEPCFLDHEFMRSVHVAAFAPYMGPMLLAILHS